MAAIRALKILMCAGILTVALSACRQDVPALQTEPKSAFETLIALCRKYDTDKCVGADRHGYVRLYQAIFAPRRASAKKILEIGVAQGQSLRLWADYFAQAAVHGMDINDSSALKLPPERIRTYVGDQSNRADLTRMIALTGSDFDIIIDDGGHTMRQQQVSLGFLFKHVRPGGLYVIEDLHTSFMSGYSESAQVHTTTLDMFYGFWRHKTVRSSYMSADELAYLNRYVDYCLMYAGTSQARPSLLAVCMKKPAPA